MYLTNASANHTTKTILFLRNIYFFSNCIASMASQSSGFLRPLCRIVPRSPNVVSYRLLCRKYHATPCYHTDGVFRALTEARVRTPWIEALRRRKAEERGDRTAPAKFSAPRAVDLKPKRMSDSYHSVVRSSRKPPRMNGYLIALAVDSTSCSRSLASRYILELFWACQVRLERWHKVKSLI